MWSRDSAHCSMRCRVGCQMLTTRNARSPRAAVRAVPAHVQPAPRLGGEPPDPGDRQPSASARRRRETRAAAGGERQTVIRNLPLRKAQTQGIFAASAAQAAAPGCTGIAAASSTTPVPAARAQLPRGVRQAVRQIHARRRGAVSRDLDSARAARARAVRNAPTHSSAGSGRDPPRAAPCSSMPDRRRPRRRRPSGRARGRAGPRCG